MDEAEWLACNESRPMLKLLRGRVSQRKALLFACACCRHAQRLGLDERGRREVEASERRADRLTAMAACPDHFCPFSFGPGLHDAEVALLRDIFGNPFRPCVVALAWLTPDVVALAQAAYQERALPSGHLAPARLAILADALEEAGASGAVLVHLRSFGPHVRGCHAVDLCLGRG
jgi:hypothetical protein